MNRTLNTLLLPILLSVATLAARAEPGKPVTTSSGLEYQVIVEGRGAPAKPGDHVRIHETTTLKDGTLIFSTRTKNSP